MIFEVTSPEEAHEALENIRADTERIPKLSNENKLLILQDIVEAATELITYYEREGR